MCHKIASENNIPEILKFYVAIEKIRVNRFRMFCRHQMPQMDQMLQNRMSKHTDDSRVASALNHLVRNTGI